MPSGVYPRTSYHNNINAIGHTGLKQTLATAQKRSQALKGRIRPQSELQHASEGLKQYYTNNPNKLTGKNNPFYGKKHTLETRQKIGQLQQGVAMPSTAEANHWNWKGGIARESYPYKFNNTLKTSIRKRDNFTCQLCGIHQNNCHRNLDIHHINGDKLNCSDKNLISLCSKCHSALDNFPAIHSKAIERYLKHKLQENIIHISVDGVLLNKEVTL